jgi:hypothetical protein
MVYEPHEYYMTQGFELASKSYWKAVVRSVAFL